MTLHLIGQLATHRGLVQQRDAVGTLDSWTMPANAYVRQQRRVPLLVEHDWQVGEVQYLQRSRASGLLMVATADDNIADLLRDHEWHLSAGVRCHETGFSAHGSEFGLATLREMSLVGRPANVGTGKVHWSTAAGAPHGLPLNWRSCWEEAHEAMPGYKYRRHDGLRIHDVDELDLYDEVMTDPESARAKIRATLPAVMPKPQPKRGSVRLHGKWLDEEQSARLIDALTNDDGTLSLT